MPVDYNKMATIAKTLIEANGKTLTVIVRSTVVADVTKPWRGTDPADQTEVTVLGIVVPFRLQRISEYSEEVMELIRRGAMRGLIAALSTDVDLQTATTIIDSSTGYKWQVKGLKVLNPGPVKLLYEFILAR